MNLVLDVFVPGNPQPKQRPRLNSFGQVHTPQETVDAEKVIRLWARAAMKGAPPVLGPVRVRYEFRRADRRGADWDNLAKTVGDALNKVAWKDDAQIVEAVVTVVRGVPDPGVRIIVEALPVPVKAKRGRKPRVSSAPTDD